MKVKLTLKRAVGPTIDIEVNADPSAKVSDIARALIDSDPSVDGGGSRGIKAPTLAVVGAERSSSIPADLEFGEAPVGSGDVVSIVADGTSAAPAASETALVVTPISGPGAGKSVRLRAGSHQVGRDASNAVVINDPLVSKQHMRLDVSRGGVRLVDLNSANGVLLDGEPVTRLDVAGGEQVLLGDTLVELGLEGAAPGSSRRESGPVKFLRSPRVEARYGGTEFTGPDVPGELDKQPFPWLSMIAPIVMGGAMFAITRSPMSIMFVALSPLLMLGNFIAGKTGRKRKFASDVAKFDDQLEALDATLSGEVELERATRLAEHPSTGEVVAAARDLGPLLWTRRPEHWNFLSLRFGTGTLPSRNTVQAEGEGSGIPAYLERLREVVDRYSNIDDVPVPENLFESGSIGVAGERRAAAGVARALLAQLSGTHSPAEVVLAAMVGPESTAEFEWLKWMPHTSSPQSPIATQHLANSATSASALVAALEEVVDVRLAQQESEGAGRGATSAEASALSRGGVVGREPESAEAPLAPRPAVIVLVTADAPIDQARMIQLAERAADAGVFPLWVAPEAVKLPAVARTFVSVDADGGAKVGAVRLGETFDLAQVETLSLEDAQAFAKSLAPVSDAGAHVVDISDLPQSINLLTLLGPEIANAPERALERWTQNDSILDRSGAAPAKSKRAGRLRALVGHGTLDAMHLDLRTQGPHALVGGTTGSGKSEFLQAWVLGMAAEYSPDRVTFLFVDYKGGAAFADCVRLPHTVGLVTDLNTHLVRRALTSLRAELHHRERLLGRKKAKDLIELERRGDPECPPALVIVIDEFAALVGEVPEFVDGVVDVAQRGRSLGIHLIMATQRPAGVIRDNLRANTNLRVALRMADADDSMDVVGEKVAAGFDPSIPGRAVAKTGPGRLTGFQSAYAGGWTSDEAPPASVEVAELRFGATALWERPEADDEGEKKETGPTDQQRLVATLSKAATAAKIPAPRKPWLDPLPPIFDLTKLRQRTDTEILLGVRDLPREQAQSEVYFRPDEDGSIAIFGTGGSGKTVALRTLTVAAGITPRGGPVEVYGIDFGNGGLGMLEALPHVGSIVPGEDPERVIRLLRTLRDELDRRGPKFAKASAGSIVDYRKETGDADLPRILLVLDGFPAFRQEFENTSARAAWYDVVAQLITEGRGLGIHVALTADRGGSVPSAIMSGIQRRVVLRLADDSGYAMLDVPNDVVTTGSPAGRAVVDGLEVQVAIAGGTPGVKDQAKAIEAIGEAMTRAGRKPANPIGILQEVYALDSLPTEVEGEPVVGISERDLEPVGFDPTGTFVLSGAPGSGRSIALAALAGSVKRFDAKAEMYYLGNSRSALASSKLFKEAATTVEKVQALAAKLTPVIEADGAKKVVVVVEGIADFLGTPADDALVSLVKAVKRSSNLLIAESETSSWTSSWPLFAEVKAGRVGVLLQPDSLDGESLFKTALPRASKADFPPGRGYYVSRGKFTRIQLPVADPAAVEK